MYHLTIDPPPENNTNFAYWNSGITIAIKPYAELSNITSNLFVKEANLPVENEFLLYTNYQGHADIINKVAWGYTDFDTFINALATTGIKLYNSSDIIRAYVYEHVVWGNIIESLDNYTGFDFPIETLRCEKK